MTVPSSVVPNTPPGPKGLPVVGVLPRIWRNPLRFFSEVAREHGPLARVGLGKFTLYLLSGPAEIEEVLQDDGSRYWKGKGLEAAAQVMGQGLATSEGETWKAQRKLMTPAFQPRRLEALTDLILSAVDDCARDWTPLADSGRAFDAAPAMSRLAQAALFRSLFGADVDPARVDAIGRAVGESNAYINHAAWTLIPLPQSIPTPRNVRFRRALRELDRAIYGLIEERRQSSGDERGDLLTRLLEATDASGQGMQDRQLRDEIMTQLVAGLETTTHALSWTLYLLGQHPELQAALAQPDSVALAERVVKESLRVYPPSWVIVRTPYKDEQLAGYPIPAGAPLLISQWVVHRDPTLWPEPERFDPDRWLEPDPDRPRYAYFPYGGGRRTCIGNHFANLILTLAVRRLCERFRWELDPRHRVVPQPTTTLKPKQGVRLRLHLNNS